MIHFDVFGRGQQRLLFLVCNQLIAGVQIQIRGRHPWLDLLLVLIRLLLLEHQRLFQPVLLLLSLICQLLHHLLLLRLDAH